MSSKTKRDKKPKITKIQNFQSKIQKIFHRSVALATLPNKRHIEVGVLSFQRAIWMSTVKGY